MPTTLKIGRSSECDIYMPYGDMSRYHATLIIEDNQDMYISDHSRNGTRVNGKKVMLGRVKIKHGDRVVFCNKYELDWNQVYQINNSNYGSGVGVKPNRSETFNSNPNYVKEFLDGLINVTEIVKHFQFLILVLFSSSQRIINIVDGKEEGPIKPIKYLSFGLTILTTFPLTDTFSTEPIFEGSIYSAWASWLFIITFALFYYAITYKIFNDVSTTHREIPEFLRLVSIFSGTNWTVTGILVWIIAVTQDEDLGVLLNFSFLVWYGVIFFRVYKRFWEMSYSNILLYSMVVILLFLMSFFMLALLLAMVTV